MKDALGFDVTNRESATLKRAEARAPRHRVEIDFSAHFWFNPTPLQPKSGLSRAGYGRPRFPKQLGRGAESRATGFQATFKAQPVS